uniref:Uncharacterized protein n=1 Tax=Anguilla anguilla TaxID=7936 RepID=A0A0E9WCX8_ANGAN
MFSVSVRHDKQWRYAYIITQVLWIHSHSSFQIFNRLVTWCTLMHMDLFKICRRVLS